jgi:transposase
MADVVMFPDPARLTLVSIEVDETRKTMSVQARTTSTEALCPLCQQSSSKVHSTYVRTLADLPCCGHQVRLQVQVRRFVCRTDTCGRKIFTERLPICAPPYARRTLRQRTTLQELAFALGGRPGARLLPVPGMAVSHDTLVRLMRQSELAVVSTPRILGIDDFAWRKGRRYGTILVYLENHQVVDVLPDREGETVLAWL